ncbi:MAG: RNA polymerase sigma factor [Bacteroidetes bacterium]|nr:RNA polymerase sigma factor [Bacteroidota bacterium]
MSGNIHIALNHEVEQQATEVQSEELTLVKRCIANERLAQSILYKKHYGVMMSVSMRYTKNRDEALEILNTGFLKVFQNLDKWQGGSLQGWIRKIITYTAIDHLRAQVRYKEQPMPEDFDVRIEDEFSSKLNASDLMNLINSLPDDQKIVFNLFAVEGYKHREIAEALNINENTSKWYLGEARKNLKIKIEKLYKF